MSDKDKKKSFEWNIGGSIKSDDYEAVPEVHDAGFHKVADALLADPQARKSERREVLTKPIQTKKEDFFAEESSSGLFHDITDSEIARLKKINEESGQIRGLNRFKKKDSE